MFLVSLVLFSPVSSIVFLVIPVVGGSCTATDIYILFFGQELQTLPFLFGKITLWLFSVRVYVVININSFPLKIDLRE